MMTNPLHVKLSGELIGELREDGEFVWNEDALPGVPLNAPS